MNITSLASSSSANAYLVNDLLIECGMQFTTLQKAVNFKLSSINACLLTHEHKDHARSAKEIMKAGIDLYTSKGTSEVLGLTGHRLNIIEPLKQFKINEWSILPFDTIHNARGALGFLLSKESEKIIFAIDTAYIKYRFQGLTRIMIECNYQNEILDYNIESGAVPFVVKNRLIRNHFSLKNVLNFLKINNSDQLRDIYLMHLSNNNCNEKEIKKMVQEVVGKPVYICSV